MALVRAAGFLIFRRTPDIEYLLLKASYGDHHWTPPKGHVDPGEDDFTTAKRETKEEAGYGEDDLKIYKNISKELHYDVRGKPKIVTYWLAELIDATKTPTLSDEHEDLRWLAREEAGRLTGYKDMIEMINYFHDQILNL